MSGALVRPVSAMAWELRTAWAVGARVSLTLEGCQVSRREGHVDRIAPTDAYVVVSGLHIPLDRVLAVHKPSRLGDSTAREGWRGPRKLGTPPQVEQLV